MDRNKDKRVYRIFVEKSVEYFGVGGKIIFMMTFR